MHSKESRPARLTIADFEALRRHEPEIVKRINARANGGRLLVLDPLRLLEEIAVDLSPEAIRAWQKHSGLPLSEGRRNSIAYHAVAASRLSAETRFRVKRLLGRAAE